MQRDATEFASRQGRSPPVSVISAQSTFVAEDQLHRSAVPFTCRTELLMCLVSKHSSKVVAMLCVQRLATSAVLRNVLNATY